MLYVAPGFTNRSGGTTSSMYLVAVAENSPVDKPNKNLPKIRVQYENFYVITNPNKPTAIFRNCTLLRPICISLPPKIAPIAIPKTKMLVIIP